MSEDRFMICGTPVLSRQRFESRFWAKVQKGEGCWEWTAALKDTGYGMFTIVKGIHKKPHRISWELANGPVPDGLHVLHRCDNKKCVNPDHLFLGTHADNMRDKVTKGIQLRGESVGNSRLKREQILEMRRLHDEEEMSSPAIAPLFGVAASCVRKVVTRQRWKHV